ncbi:DJ-1/PfpI family protein [Jeotgalibacillus campisalis]|uniref:DJ-1/PfpI domain-containing protein n=1 Tax=Jeotgalibacillus campisalis TaxID=220754 RepID=A0A0C2W397_9BACL|nr:DJ-1/PfpI family protein [Jeotgalibacillus campisalis]KIL51096.1 hypothetical protein KR50_09770 [Jeotgalibacillus campisalis]
MKKTAILLYPQFSEYELSVALSILMQGNKPSVTVGLNHQPIKGESGLSCLVDSSVDEIKFSEFDSLLLPGCMDVMTFIKEPKLTEFVKQVNSSETVIASISSSPLLLAKAGLLRGRKFTVGLTEEAIENLGVFEKENYSEDVVVKDGNIITARGRGFIRFGIEFGKALKLTFDESWYKE